MPFSKTIGLISLFAFALCINLPSKADAEFNHPPMLPESEKIHFNEWLEIAKGKNEDKVFSNAEGVHLNALVNSASPYLRQHAKNPVNWKPWRNKFLEQARSKNKLIFLSIGYSTCHWCHVMKKESFADAEIARAINGSYIAIKVDREELPQIDKHYASLLEAVKGSAGWPITAIISSEGLPIYIDSYIPKEKLITLLGRVDSTWKTNPEFLLTTAKNISNLIATPESEHDEHPIIDTAELLNTSKKKVIDALDSEFGGLKGEVKFPQEALLLYLLDELRRDADPDLKNLVSTQLNNMMNGGIRDHVNGGFHRYSTDSQWMIPHYEKMLYNQALMTQVYLEAWQVFYDDNYRYIAQETLDFAIEYLYQEGEGFYSALDADFKGEEGGFYLWPKADIEDVLKVEGISFYAFKPDDEKPNKKFGILTEPGLRSPDMSEALNKLSRQRKNREDLHRDDKVITSWNGLMIYSLAMTSRELENKEYSDIAEEVGDFLWTDRFDEKTGKLFRTTDRTQELFSLEDYAYLSRGFIGLYDVTQNPKWLERASAIYRSAKADSDLSQFIESPKSEESTSFSVMDGELISPEVAFQEAELALNNRTLNPELFKANLERLNHIKSRVSESAINRFSSLLYLNNELNGNSAYSRYFANGVGRFSVICTKIVEQDCVAIELQFNLKKGWHINSNKPLQDYLAPTIIKSKSELMVDYPQYKVVKLGFQDEPLTLFEDEFKILISKIPGEMFSRIRISVPLQACNNEICLLPEESVVIF